MNRKRHLFHIHSSTYGSFLRKKILLYIVNTAGFKALFHMHGADFDEFIEEVGAVRISKVLKRADVLVVLSESWKEQVQMLLPSLNRIRVLYNPCPLPDKVHQTQKEIRHEAVEVSIVFTGRIGERKGAFDLIHACANIRETWPEQLDSMKLIMIGDGEIRKAKDLASRLNVQDMVEIWQWISYDELQSMYQGFDIFVLPSYSEGMPMSLLEAMANGLPVITTDIKGIRECVENGVNGWLVTPGDMDALGSSIRKLVLDPELRRRMGQAARERAFSEHAPDIIVKRLHRIYEDMCKGTVR